MQFLSRIPIVVCCAMLALPAYAQKSKHKKPKARPAATVRAADTVQHSTVIPEEASLHADLKKRKKVVIVPAPPPPPGPDPIPPKQQP